MGVAIPTMGSEALQGHPGSKVRFVRDPDLEQIEARASYYRRQVFRKHTHEAYAVGLVRQGATDFWYENRTRTVRADDIALINPEGVHACNPRPGGVLTYCMFYIETDLMKRVARGVFDQDGELPRFARPVVQDPHLWQAFTNLYTLMLRSEDKLERQACLYETLSELVSGYTIRRAPPVPSDDCLEPLHSVQEYLVQNMRRNSYCVMRDACRCPFRCGVILEG